MKFRVSFKTPDAVDYAIENVLGSERNALELNEDAFIAREEIKGTIKEMCDKFVSYGECVTIEFDTETKTATVVEKPSGRY